MSGSARSYDDTYAAWRRDPAGWWAEAAKGITWDTPPAAAFDGTLGVYGRWFPGGRLNTCFNAVDRHVAAGRGAQPAIIWDSPMTGRIETTTYAELQQRVAKIAGALAERGVGKGDRVVIYMPMVPEAAMAMLACARLGAVHSVVFGGFAAAELAARIADAKPKAIVSASCGLEPGRVVKYKPLLDAAIGLSPHKPSSVLILQREAAPCELTPGRDEDLLAAEAAAAPHPCVPVESTDPLYILYTSGTTGAPKGILRDNGGHAVALHNSMSMVYGVGPGDVFWAASDVGWVVGHSYIVYAPLLAGCATVLFEGKPVGTPDAGTFWRVCEQHRVKVLFTAPTAIRAIKKEDPDGAFLKRYDLSRMEALYLAGERCDPDTITWSERLLAKPVVDHWWQTETGWTITGNFRGLGLFPTRAGSGGKPAPGYDVVVLDEAHQEVPRGQIGSLAVRLPLPPSCLPTLFNADDRFREAYLSAFPGYYSTADAGMVDEDGYVWVMSRTDDIINVAGHRLSTGAMEEVLASHPDVAECAVVGVRDTLKGQVPLGLVVLKSGVAKGEEAISKELIAMVRDQIGPVAAFKDARVVARLPKTRSGKILRATLRKIADGDDYVVPPTIDDPAILDEVGDVLKAAMR
ncbi:AMP-binding protein [Neoroseomonas oryzicola]|uniref:Propionyl-CoA synthetase n=1 Tax=Neoroseomonas oryzicola TaxID=535904 RepID=A0A9X9WNP2_9PROT|nr:AMP-binding protein [Neoroseomonas oryzicola]MBR0661952.1 propionyl-CoA synthetase [Neoroseomonas oryzicola]NKE16108.1 propionyl-CoA synthetase [Neoroseomonas oryzicola]